MPVGKTRLNLKRIVGGSGVYSERIDLSVIRIDAVLVRVVEACEARPFASHITDFDSGSPQK